MKAMRRSQQLLRPLRWQVAIPFILLIAAGRLVEAAKGALLGGMPPRFYTELLELPLGVLLGGSLLSIWLARLQDILPFVAYTEGKENTAES